MSESKRCGPIPCPGFETMSGFEVVAVCNCGDGMAGWPFRACHEVWGNPYGRLDCPVHGDLVRERIAEGMLEIDRSDVDG